MNAREILTAFMMSPDELPGWSYLSRGTNSQALSEGNNEWKLTAARDVGLRPLLHTFEDFINAVIMPLIDPELAKEARFQFCGLDAQSREDESKQLAEDQSLWMTYDDIQERVERPPLGRRWGGALPLNPVLTAWLKSVFTVGQILEHFCDVAGASQDPKLAYIPDPAFLQWQQLNAAPPAQPGQPPGQGGSPPPGGGPPQQPAQPEPQPPHPVARAIEQAAELLHKSEAHLEPHHRVLLLHHDRLVEHFRAGFEKDAEAAVRDILRTVERNAP